MEILDYVYTTNVVSKQICDDILSVIKNKEWQKHTWYSNINDTKKSEETKELDVQPTSETLQQILNPCIIEAGRQYNEKFALKEAKLSQFIKTFSPCRFNRYEPGTVMRKHYDHIHSIFDGQRKGIPVLSMLGILNNDYEGGEFLVRDKQFKLKQGDMIIFPSCFMYPHEVKEVTKGIRYSFISWAF
jgi:predicted 2-oxoglutarate/Fe(II)-dependent dioxygenase YbiX|tara:strand:- start:893 stop:1453 length:561 start_codon:yes stop_codon:yes gene_type:complete